MAITHATTKAPGQRLFAVADWNAAHLTPSINLTGATGNTLIVDTNVLVVDATNNRVGIGTTSPSQELSVQGTGGIIGLINSTNNDYSTIEFVNQLNNKSYVGVSSYGLSLSGNVYNSNHIIVTSSGNVGINTTTPTDKLEVAGNIRLLKTGTATSETQYPSYALKFYPSSWSTYENKEVTRRWQIRAEGTSDYWGFGDLVFMREAVEIMRIQGATKNVGIGTTNPRAKLDVAGALYVDTTTSSFPVISDAGTYRAGVRFDGINTDLKFSMTANAGDTWSDKMTIKYDGKVGIGTTEPAVSAILDLTSTTGALLLPRMTTAQKNALTAINGMLVYDTTLNKFQGYENGAWVSLI